MQCDICDSTGYVVLANGTSVPCDKCHNKRLLDNLCRRARISQDWRKRAKYPLSLYPDFKVYFGVKCNKRITAPEEYFDLVISRPNEFPSLYIWGDNGRGKSHIVYSLVLEMIRRYGVTAFVVTEARLLNLAFDKPTNERIENDVEIVKDRLEDSQVLIIDDIGATALDSKGYKEGFINKVIRNRREDGKVTWMTSNVPPIHMEGHFGKRLASYLIEACHFLKFSTKADLRLQVQKKIVKSIAHLLEDAPNGGN